MRQRILYVQYTNPCALPPLEHSSRILADSGWEVLFLGTGAIGALNLEFPPHPRIRVERISFCPPGIRQKLHYIGYCLWVLWTILTWRPKIVYSSDLFTAPVAWIASWVPGVRVVTHDHDCVEHPTGFAAFLNGFQRMLRPRALCVWPNARRAQVVAPDCENRIIVWNCPRRDEVGPPRQPPSEGLEVFYHGSFNANRLPVALIQALALLPKTVRLTLVGYDTVVKNGHLSLLKGEADKLYVADRLTLPGHMPRYESIKLCRKADVGITFMPLSTSDVNEDNMIGPSNKAFDYLACGAALLMADRPDWRAAFADTGMGLTCDPQSSESIASALRWFLEHPLEMREMGERGRQRILADWNYETQFQPVLDLINGGS